MEKTSDMVIKDSKRLLFLLAGAAGMALSFPAWNLWFLAWIAVIPLMAAVIRWFPEKIFLTAWIYGSFSSMISFSWVTHSIIVYGGLPGWAAGIALIVMAAFLGLFIAFPVRLAEYIYQAAKGKIPRLILWPLCWVAFEYIRASMPWQLAFPWNSLGNSQHCVPFLLQNADWGSFYGLSFLIVMTNSGLYALLSGNREHKTALAVVIPALAGALVYGAVRYYADYGNESFRVGIIQGNVDLHEKWDTDKRYQTLMDHIGLSRQLIEQEPDLFIWAESSVPFNYRHAWYYENGKKGALGYHLATFIETTGIPLLTGTLDRVDSKLYNAVVLALPDGTDTYFYKKRLVPFGEFVPFKTLLFFVNRLVEDQIGEFTPGESADPLNVPGGPGIAVTVCYENIFPELVRERIRAGGGVICNVTNDAWFGETSAAYQHFSMARFRAVETRRPVVRSANSGISGAIDSKGRILIQSPIFVKQSFVVDVITNDGMSPYLKFGNVFASGCLFLTIVLYITAVIKRRNSFTDGGCACSKKKNH